MATRSLFKYEIITNYEVGWNLRNLSFQNYSFHLLTEKVCNKLKKQKTVYIILLWSEVALSL